MEWMDSIMQYAIYLALGVCGVCLLASIVIFVTMDRNWRAGVEEEAEQVMMRARYKETVRADSVTPTQWEEIRHRLEEMQVMADESGRPLPYKNVA